MVVYVLFISKYKNRFTFSKTFFSNFVLRFILIGLKRGLKNRRKSKDFHRIFSFRRSFNHN